MKHVVSCFSLLIASFVSAPAWAASPPVQTTCVGLDAAEEAPVRQICAAVLSSKALAAAERDDVWKQVGAHGLTKAHATGKFSHFKDKEVVRSALSALDVEALIVVELRSATEAGLITFAFDGSRTVVPAKLVDGKLANAEGSKVGGYTVMKTRSRVAEFRERGGWAGTVTSSELDGLDASEAMALKLKRVSRCYRHDKNWVFCQPDRIGTGGFVFGQKGKPFTYVKAGGSFVGGVHLGTFDEPGFERSGELSSASRDFDAFADAGAPAFLVKPSEPRAALACGKKTAFLEPMSYEASRKLLADVTIRFAPSQRHVGLRKTEDGTYIWTETIRHASGAQDHRVFVGKLPKLKERTIKDRAFFLDGGTTIYKLGRGGEIFLPANMWVIRPGDDEQTMKTMPDGSKVPEGARFAGEGFKWAQYVAKSGAKPQKLYVVEETERQRVLSTVTVPPPVDNETLANAVCGVVMPKTKVK